MHATLTLALAASLGVGTLARQIAEPVRTPHANLQVEQSVGLPRMTHVTAEGVHLSYLLVTPAKRDFRYRTARGANGNLHYELRVKPVQSALPARGAVIFLHGWSGNGDQFAPWALALAERGYAGIAVDLRGHGDSSDAPAGYGPREAADIADLVRALLAEGRIRPPVYLIGSSYGATTALFAEPALRDALDGIVAFAPFPSAQEGIRGALDLARASDAHGIGGHIARAVVRRIDDDDVDAAIERAGKRLGTDLRTVDARPIVAASRTCILFLHGADDRMFPPSGSQALAAGSTVASATVVPGHGHVDLPMRVDWLAAPVTEWMAASAQREGGACPIFALPPEPRPGD